MAILRSGILGRASGKVAGVVGAHWKGVSYIREKVIPTNPNTTLQQAQRAKMTKAVQFAKLFIGPVFNKYQDHFEKMMSGYNRFISTNLVHFISLPAYDLLKLTQGKLYGPDTVVAAKNVTMIDVVWNSTVYGSNGLATDKVYSVCFNHTNKLANYAAAEVNRSAGTLSMLPPPGTQTSDHVVVYTWAAKYSLTSPTLLELISDSAYNLVTW